MHSRLPTLNGLRAIEAAARLGSFTLAADHLSVTQSSISRLVKTVEDDLQITLFVRNGPHVTLTNDGQIYADQLSQAFRLLERATATIRPNRRSRPFTLSVIPSFSSKWLSSRLHGFLEANPRVDLRLSLSRDLVTFDDGLDAAIRFGRGHWKGCHAQLLFVEKAIAVCSPALASRLELDTADSESLCLAPLLRGDGPVQWSDWLNQLDTPAQHVEFGPSFDDGAAMLQAAMSGLGIALTRTSLASDDLAAGRLVQVGTHAVKMDYQTYLVWPRDRAAPPALEAFKSWILGEIGSD